MDILTRIENNVEWYFKNHDKMPSVMHIGASDFDELKNHQASQRILEYNYRTFQYVCLGIPVVVNQKFERHLSYS